MVSHTPKMSVPELGMYLEEHLIKELEWLLRAATEWHVQVSLNLCITGYEVQVFAADSAFLHARTLFEFLTQRTTGIYYGCDAFGIVPRVSPLYTGPTVPVVTDRAWKGEIHAALMHAQVRTQKGPIPSFDGLSKKALHEMPVDFAKEVVRLWRDFAKALSRHSRPAIAKLERVANDGLSKAIDDAVKVACSRMATAPGKSIPEITWPCK